MGYRLAFSMLIMHRIARDIALPQISGSHTGSVNKVKKNIEKSYREFVKKGIALGKRPDLTGGGLIRSMGGWSIVKAMRNSGIKEESDARILGSGEFVSERIKHAEEKVKYQLPALELQKIIMAEIEIQCKKEKVAVGLLQSGSRRPPLPKLRRAIALKLINEYGVSLAETARRLGISTSGVAQILRRSERV